MKCEYCGRVLKPGEYVCPGCGAAVENPEPVSGANITGNVGQGTKINVSVGGVNISIDGDLSGIEANKPEEATSAKKAESIHKAKEVAEERKVVPPLEQPVEQRDYRGGIKYGGFFLRVCATWLDWMICLVIFIGLAVMADLDIEIGSFMAVWCIYDVICQTYFGGATPGKKGMRIKVVNKAYQKVGLGQAIIRSLSKAFLWPICIGYLMVLFSSQKRSLHDCIAGTYVIKD